MSAAPATEAHADAAARAMGCLELALEQRDGRTVARRSFAQPPFQLSRVRYDVATQPGTAAFTLLHLGGVLSGDRARLTVELAAGTTAQVHMAAATQVYRMPEGDAAHTLELRLGPGARLDWLAHPTILFGGSRFAQTTRIVLAPGARLAFLDVLVPGRLASGERFAFARYASRLDVCDEADRLLVAERALLEPGRSPLERAGLLGAAPVVGSLFLLGPGFDAERCAALLATERDALAGATELPNGAGVLVRQLGHSASTVHSRLLELWNNVKDCSQEQR